MNVISFDNMTDEHEFEEGGTILKGKAALDWKNEDTKIFLKEIDVRIEKLKKNTFIILSNRNNIQIPQKGETLRIRTQAQVNLISIIIAVLEKHGKIDELYITTYTFNKEAFDIILDQIKKHNINRFSLILTSSYSFRNPKHYREIKKSFILLNNLGFEVSLVFATIHMKITLMRCGENYYLHEGSMNYSTNNLAEQLLFQNDEKSYIHDKNFIENIIKTRKSKSLEIVI